MMLCYVVEILTYCLAKVATLLDKAYQTTNYSDSIVRERAKINDTSLTPSAKILSIMLDQGKSVSEYSLEQAAKYREESLARPYQFYSEDYFIAGAKKSHQEQSDIENKDKLNFDDFLADYFN